VVRSRLESTQQQEADFLPPPGVKRIEKNIIDRDSHPCIVKQIY